MDASWKVIAAFVGVFIAGAIFGGVFTIGASGRHFSSPAHERGGGQGRTKAGPHPMQGRGNPLAPRIMRQLTQRLDLTEEQRERIRPLVSRAGEDYVRIQQQNLADTARVTERMYGDVAAILTPDQRTELDRMRRQMQDRVQAERKRRAEAAAADAANRKERAKANRRETP